MVNRLKPFALVAVAPLKKTARLYLARSPTEASSGTPAATLKDATDTKLVPSAEA